MQRPGPPGWELDARLTILLCKNSNCCKREVKAGRSTNLAEFSIESLGLKKGCFAD
jgi:hypothetical protein